MLLLSKWLLKLSAADVSKCVCKLERVDSLKDSSQVIFLALKHSTFEITVWSLSLSLIQDNLQQTTCKLFGGNRENLYHWCFKYWKGLSFWHKVFENGLHCWRFNPFPHTTNLQQVSLMSYTKKKWKLPLNESTIIEYELKTWWQKEKLLVLSNFFPLSPCFQKAVCFRGVRKHLYELSLL